MENFSSIPTNYVRIKNNIACKLKIVFCSEGLKQSVNFLTNIFYTIHDQRIPNANHDYVTVVNFGIWPQRRL